MSLFATRINSFFNSFGKKIIFIFVKVKKFFLFHFFSIRLLHVKMFTIKIKGLSSMSSSWLFKMSKFVIWLLVVVSDIIYSRWNYCQAHEYKSSGWISSTSLHHYKLLGHENYIGWWVQSWTISHPILWRFFCIFHLKQGPHLTIED